MPGPTHCPFCGDEVDIATAVETPTDGWHCFRLVHEDCGALDIRVSYPPR